MADKRKRVLIIAYVFPPIAYAGTHRTLRLCKYLSRLGYDLHVVTIKVQKDIHNDFDLVTKVKNEVTIHRTETIDVWRYYNKHKKRFLKTKTGRFIDRVISFLIAGLSQPDHMNLWVPFAFRTAKKMIKRYNIEMVYTTSPPHSQLITGFLLKRMTGVAWIADLRDPILFNIGSASWKKFERAVNRFLENFTIRNTDAIITNTRAARDELTYRYNLQKVYCVPNSYDDDDFEELNSRKYPKFTIAHLGTVYGFRNSEALFETIARLHQSGEIIPDEFELRFYGIIDKILKATIEKYKLWAYVQIMPLVEHRKALEVMHKSHMLLLLKGFNPKGLGQIPGKLFEYIGTGNPILYIGPEKCEAAEIVQETGNGYITGEDKNNIRIAILKEFSKFKKQKGAIYQPQKNKKHLMKFTSREMARRVDALFDSFGCCK